MEWRLVFHRGRSVFAFTALCLIVLKRTAKRLVGRGIPKEEGYEWSGGEADGLRGNVLLASHESSVSSGAFRSCTALADELRRKHKFNVVVVLAQSGDGEETLKSLGVPYIVIPSRLWLVNAGMEGRKTYRRMVNEFLVNHAAVHAWIRLIKRKKIDLVHVNSMSAYVAGLAALRTSCRLVWHMRDLLEEDHNLKIYNRDSGYELISQADRMIAVSECVKQKYTPIFGASKVVKILNGVDVRRFYFPHHEILRGPKAVFVFLGNFQRKKGPIEFSMACAEAFRRGLKKIEVWFIGEDQEHLRPYFDEIFTQAGMSDNVRYFGLQKEPERILVNADVAVVCSKCEAFGRVTVEMMLSGCLLIGADTGGTKELIQDNETGFLYRYVQNSASNLPDRLMEAVADPERSRAIAKRGQDYMARHMTAERNADEVAEVYRSLLGDCRSQG